MSTLEEHRDSGAEDAGAGEAGAGEAGAGEAGSAPGGGARGWPAWLRGRRGALRRWAAGLPGPGQWRAGLASLPALLRRHWLFAIALGLGVVVRAIVMAGFTPAALFELDTYDYLWGATHLAPNPVNPSGYSVFLWLFWPVHSLFLIAALQHLMGLGIAVMVYAVLRRRAVAAWLAVLAAVPVLFDPAQLLIEQLVMADILAMFLMVVALAVVLTSRSPSAARSAVAAAAMGASAVVRPTTLPLIVLLAVYLLVIRSGWRTAVAALAAGLLPVAAYVAWFAAVSGAVGMTDSDGLFLWSRTMSFANCAIIRPPASLRELCPDQQSGGLEEADPALRALPRRYLWNHGAWLWRQPHAKSIVPDTDAFTAANNTRARDFAIMAITAQPADYAKVVAEGAVTPFVRTDRLRFPSSQASTIHLSAANRRYMLAAVRDYVGTTAGTDLGMQYGAHQNQPYARLIQRYQDWVFLRGRLLGLIVLAGLAGILIPRTRTAAAMLLWVAGAVVFVLPVAEHEYTYRYVIPAVPLACLAAALAARNRAKDAQASPGAAAPPGAA